MNKTDILNSLNRTFGRATLQLKKHSPEILVVAGITTGIGAAVMACKATTKASAIIEESKVMIDKIHETDEKLKAGEVVKYTAEDGTVAEYKPEDIKQDLTITYTQTGLELIKTYAPAIAMGALSITCILAGHNIMKKRNAGLAAAYVALDTSFKEYRGRVVERFGKELDRELKFNIKAQEVEETVVNEDGSEQVIKKTVNVVDPNQFSEYARIWCEGNIGWDKNPEYNRMFLARQQSYMNDKLRTRGHVFLNEVYDALGFNRTQAGNVVGWIYNENDPNGDNFIDFGMFDIHDQSKINFINGDERSIILDFNVDGPILELI